MSKGEAPDPRANRAFWEARGEQGGGRGAVLLAEHARFVDYLHDRELAYIGRWLACFARPPAVLDGGCGTGRLAVALAPRASSVTGTDVAASMVERAREAARESGAENARFERCDLAEAFAPREPRFDLVVISGVLQYVGDDAMRDALAGARAVLRPGGLLYLRNNCATRRRELHTDAARGGYAALYRTPDEYVRAVRATGGLALLEERYLFPPLCAPNLVYFHALPRALRDRAPIARALDAWFAAERATAEARVLALGSVYPWLLRAVRKPTAFRVLVARAE